MVSYPFFIDRLLDFPRNVLLKFPRADHGLVCFGLLFFALLE